MVAFQDCRYWLGLSASIPFVLVTPEFFAFAAGNGFETVRPSGALEVAVNVSVLVNGTVLLKPL